MPEAFSMRLDDDWEPELLGGLHRLPDRAGRPAVRDGNAVLSEQPLALVFEEIHGGR